MKKKIYEILRHMVAKKATHNLGKVKIYDDKIVCYVDGRKLKKKEKYLHRYDIMFHCILSADELYKIYRVDKPVHYIIQDVDFDMEVNIQTAMKDCRVTFENCTFTGAVEIDFGDHIIFKNNKYRPQTYKNYLSIYKEGEFCISTRGNKNEINKLEFFNENISMEETLSTKSKKNTISVYLYGKEIKLIDTDIDNAENIEIGADNLYLNNSDLCAEEVEVDATNIDANICEITSEVASINTSHIVDTFHVKSGALFINGVEINRHEKNIDIGNLELQKQRLELVNTLKKIGFSCEETIAYELRKQPLTRLLKR